MSVFRFKQFSILQADNAMKVGTDAMLLGAIASQNSPKKLLDIGAGTGVISLMLAQKFPEATIHAVELDAISAEECRSNFEASPWAQRLSVSTIDFLEFQSEASFDCIVSNPPFYQTRLENQDVRKSVARHESSLPVNQMLEKVSQLLTPNASFWVIVPSETREDWLDKATQQQLFCNEEIVILGKRASLPKRSILSFGLTELTFKSSSVPVREANGNYTQTYIDLTVDFHFNDLQRSIE